jgi:hypothetical protein
MIFRFFLKTNSQTYLRVPTRYCSATYNVNYSYKYILALNQIEHIAFTNCHLHHELIEPTIYPISTNQSMIPRPCRA